MKQNKAEMFRAIVKDYQIAGSYEVKGFWRAPIHKDHLWDCLEALKEYLLDRNVRVIQNPDEKDIFDVVLYWPR